MSLKCGSASYGLVGIAPDDFPPVVPAAQANRIRFEAKTLREMLAATSFAISYGETLYVLNGETHGSWPGGADWAETSALSRRSPFQSSNRHSVGTPPKQSPTNALATPRTAVLACWLRNSLAVRLAWLCVALFAGRSGTDTPIEQSGQRYPHLWTTLCVSEGWACVG